MEDLADDVGKARLTVISSPRRVLTRPETGGFIAAIIVFAFFAIFAGGNGFLGSVSTANWLNTSSQMGIVAVPVGMLMIGGEFDLSIGAVAGASSITVGIVTGGYGLSAWIGIVLALLIAAIVGGINGIIVVKTRLPSFIVTLATMLMLTGTTLGVSILMTGSSNTSATSSGFPRMLFASSWGNFSVSVLWWIALLAVAGWVMSRSVFGNWAYATGGNEQAARLVGVPTARVKVILFMSTSLCASLTAILQTLSLNNGNVTLDSNYIFEAIAAAVIGGVILTGGYGSPVGTGFGAVTYGIISAGVLLLGWSADLAQLFIGALLLVAVLANHRLRMLALGKR